MGTHSQARARKRPLAALIGLSMLAASACEHPPPQPGAEPGAEPGADPVTAGDPETPTALEAPPLAPPNPDVAGLAELRDAYPGAIAFDPKLQQGRWFDAAFALAEREHVPAAFKAADYKAPRGSLLLVARIEPGVGQPRLHYFTIGDTGWLAAPKYFVPASTVKLMASISALLTLNKHGLTGDARLRFNDIQGRFNATAYDLYKDALLHSSNENYNRLIGIAGFDETNTQYVTAEMGLPVMAIQSRYGAANRGVSLRTSSVIKYSEDGREGEIPKRKGVWRRDDCRGNCTTLFELQDIMRRVVLHDELPVARRWPLARVDLERIQGLLLQARDRLQPSPNRAFDEDVQVYNEVGRIPGRVLLENSYLRGETSGRRLMLALSLRFVKDHDPKPELQVMAEEALRATVDAPLAGPGLQADAGPDFEISLRASAAEANVPTHLIWVTYAEPPDDGPAQSIETFEAWVGNTQLSEPRTLSVNGERHVSWPLNAAQFVQLQPAIRATAKDKRKAPPAPRAQPLIVIGKRGDTEVAYRSRWLSPVHASPLGP